MGVSGKKQRNIAASPPERRRHDDGGAAADCALVRRWLSAALDRYTRLVFDYPLTVFLSTFLCFGVVPLATLYAFPLRLDSNPEKGFDTRGTQYAGPRLAWAELQPSLLQGSRVVVEVPPRHVLLDAPDTADNQTLAAGNVRAPEKRPKRNDAEATTSVVERRQRFLPEGDPGVADERLKRSWADDLLASFSSVACYDDPIPAMNYLSQMIISVSSYDDLFSADFLGELCDLQQRLGAAMHLFDHFTPYRSVWHVANYFACLAPESRVNCSYLTPDDIRRVRADVELCATHRRIIVDCRRSCERHLPIMQDLQNAEAFTRCDMRCKRAAGIPRACTAQMMADLFYRVLPKDFRSRPFHMNAFLPFYTFASYRMQGYAVELPMYTEFEARLREVARDTRTYELKGLLMDVKRDILLEAAVSDSKFSLFAGLLVFAIIALYSLSASYSLVVLWQLMLSVFTALCVYRAFNAEFPLLNLIVFVLLISIGSDGAFLLLSGFPAPERLNHVTFAHSLRHTMATMFLTQFSTVVPFFLNILSNVVAFRSFGLFAGLTLIANYVLLVSFLPAFLVLQYRYLNPWITRHLPSSFWYCFPSVSFNGSSATRRSAVADDSTTALEQFCANVQTLIHDVLPMVLVQGRFVWLCSLSIVLALCGVICITQLQLPQYNPLQLFIGSNPHEYYDNHAEQHFHFVASKIALPLSVRLVWGIEPPRSIDYFDPQQLSALRANADFRLSSTAELRRLAAQLKRFRALPFVQLSEKFWPEKYLDWSRRLACSEDEETTVCCNVESAQYSDAFLDYCMRVSTAQLHTAYNDTPIYHNVTFDLVGYTALIPTTLKYSHRYSNLSDSFRQFDQEFRSSVAELPMWYTTEWHLMSTWYDLQRSIIADCKQSVLVSFAVVLAFAAAILRWKCVCAMVTIPSIIVTTTGTVVFLGWEIGVLEGVILVLVVGLSFDYTLHYGASIPDDGCATHRIQESVRRSTLPVTMAAFSSIVAGATMLFAQTHAFFQVAVFLVVSTTTSFIFATFFFLPLLHIFMASEVEFCRWCDADRCAGRKPPDNRYPTALQLRHIPRY